MRVAFTQTPVFEIHRAEPEDINQEPSDMLCATNAEQVVPELSECYSEPER